MAVNPGEINYEQGRGEAFILPPEDFTGLRRLTDAGAERNRKLLELKLRQKAEREKLTNDILNKDLKAPARRDVEAVSQSTNEMRQYVVDQLKQGNSNAFKAGTPEWQKLRELQQKAQWGAEQSVAEEKWLNNAINDIKSSSDPYLDKQKAMDSVLKNYYGEDGTKNVYTQNSSNRPNWMEDAFNAGKWMKDFTKDLPEIVAKNFSLGSDGQGRLIVTEETKGKFFELNKNGTVKRDRDGNPVLKVSPETATLALQDPRFNRYIQSEMQKPENRDKTEQQLVEEKLKVFGYANTMKDAKTGHSFSKAGEKDENSNEDNVLTEISKLIQHDTGKLQTGVDEPIQMPDGNVKILRKVNSLIDLKKLGVGENGGKITLLGIYIDPSDKEGFYTKDSEGNVQKYDNNNVYDLISILTENTGEYNRTRMDKILKQKSGYSNGVFKPDRFFQQSPAVKQEILANEQDYQQGVEAKKEQAKQLLGEMETSGFMERLSNFLGNENSNKLIGEKLQNEILNGAGLKIDGKKYPDLKIEVNGAGEFTLRDNQTGKAIRENLSNTELKALFEQSEFIPKRTYLESNNSSGNQKEKLHW